MGGADYRRLVKRIAVALVLFAAGRAFALDVNTASQAELEQLPGIGVALSERLLEARRASPFRDWDDLLARVRGLRAQAAKLSAAGLSVGGQPYAAARGASATR
jgi:competence protein ComEA